jgi:hypothetical protein
VSPAPVSGTIAGFDDGPVGGLAQGEPLGPPRGSATPPSLGVPFASGPAGSPRHRADSHSAAPGAPVGEDGLPRRIRQRSLAPQLRRPPREDRAGAQPQEAAPPSPDEVRAKMSALQAGTVRGRQDATLRLPADVWSAETAASTGDSGPWDAERGTSGTPSDISSVGNGESADSGREA